MTPLLFPTRRTCLICGASEAVRNRWHKPTREAFVAAINVTIWRRRTDDRQQMATSSAVHVCERCLVLASQSGKEMEALGRALVGAAVSRYSVMAKGELI